MAFDRSSDTEFARGHAMPPVGPSAMPSPSDMPPRDRGVYVGTKHLGVLFYSVYDGRRMCIATGQRLNVPGHQRDVELALWEWLDEIDPEHAVAPMTDAERMRALLSVADGGNKPPRGRPRTKPRRLGVVAGGLNVRRTGRRPA